MDMKIIKPDKGMYNKEKKGKVRIRIYKSGYKRLRWKKHEIKL